MHIDELVKQAISHQSYLEASKRDIRDNEIQIKRKQEELNNISSILKTTKYSYSYLDKLVKEESGKFIKKVNEILNYGVQTIFDDCNYSIEIRVADNSRVTIHLVYEDSEGNVVSPELNNVGGGIRTVVGTLLQCFFIFHYKVEPLLIVDEGFSQVSSRYIPNLMELLKELCDKNGLKILLITHDTRLLPYADKRYLVNNGTAKEIKGDTTDEYNPD